jgi:hypothetical protein
LNATPYKGELFPPILSLPITLISSHPLSFDSPHNLPNLVDRNLLPSELQITVSNASLPIEYYDAALLHAFALEIIHNH